MPALFTSMLIALPGPRSASISPKDAAMDAGDATSIATLWASQPKARVSSSRRACSRSTRRAQRITVQPCLARVRAK